MLWGGQNSQILNVLISLNSGFYLWLSLSLASRLTASFSGRFERKGGHDRKPKNPVDLDLKLENLRSSTVSNLGQILAKITFLQTTLINFYT